MGYEYAEAVEYWTSEGSPDRMDADENGIPCQTVYDHADIVAVWGEPLPTTKSEEFAFLVSVDLGPPATIVADYAEWFAEDDAQRACEADGCQGDYEWGNLYYIRNVNPRLRTLQLADDVLIATTREDLPYDLHANCVEATPDILADAGLSENRFSSIGGCLLTVDQLHSIHDFETDLHMKVWLTINHGEITAIQGQYVP
jgi:hypothetical protein